MKSTLPKWMTLTQAAEWLSEQTRAIGQIWTIESLLDTLTTIGPLQGLSDALPIWLLPPMQGLTVELPDAAMAIPSKVRHLPIKHETLQLFCIHRTIDSSMVDIAFIDDRSSSLAPGTAISREWLAVQGIDLYMFLMAYANVQKSLQEKSDRLTALFSGSVGESPKSRQLAATIEFEQPLQKGESQDRAILKAISHQGLDPKSLPPHKNGTRGVKADLKELLLKERRIFPSASAFDRAWERLMKSGDIANA